MTPTVLVVTTVHTPDDTRIRDRLIASLAERFRVVYVCRVPGPSEGEDLTWVPLRGGRLRRNARALRTMLRTRWDVAVVHDPELIPAAMLARLAKKRPVVFDVHEDLAAQIEAKRWIPRWLAPAARGAARLLYRTAERVLVLTLAESGYDRMFRHHHPVFPNYPNYDRWPPVGPEGNGRAVYVGDVQPARGLREAVEASGKSATPLTVIGRCSVPFADELRRVASAHGTDLHLIGPMPNRQALEAIAVASVGLSPLLPFTNYLDSLPTKTIEYLAMGVPVVASDLPGTREVLQGRPAVWMVAPGDVEEMAGAIRAAVQPDAKEAAVRQIEEVRQAFNWPREEVVRFYESLMER